MIGHERSLSGLEEYITPKPDPVNNPSHYTSGGIETIAYLEAKLTPEEFRGFLKGNALKYLSRAGKKQSESEDIEKAAWYTNRLQQCFKERN